MRQIVIDPRQSPENPIGEISPTALLPRDTRAFGFVPDLSRCLPGDLVLSKSISPGWVERRISNAQILAGADPEDSCWTHAAVFLYEDFIVEAVPWRGVIARTLYSDIPESVLRVRRRPNLQSDERYKIALCAQRMLGSRYNVDAVIFLGIRAISGLWNRSWVPQMSRVAICSKVFYDAHVEITRTLLKGCPIADLVMPAHLSATSDLEDVEVPWLKLS